MLTFTVVQALELIEEQMKKVNQRIDALLLVGGFSGSTYLFKRVQVSSFCARCVPARWRYLLNFFLAPRNGSADE
jgi:methanogenic corrinoid protein MtbC1